MWTTVLFSETLNLLVDISNMFNGYSFWKYGDRDCFKDQKPFVFPNYLVLNKIFQLSDCLIRLLCRKKPLKNVLPSNPYLAINLVELEEQNKVQLAFLLLDRDCSISLSVQKKKMLKST